MSTPTASVTQLVDLGRRGQDANVTAVEATTRALQAYTEAVGTRSVNPGDPQVATNAGFDLAARLLRVQREYATTTVSLLTEARQVLTAQASAAGETFKARTEQAAKQATEQVTDLATEATRRAAAAGRNGVTV
jgi:hypothetical protein